MNFLFPKTKSIDEMRRESAVFNVQGAAKYEPPSDDFFRPERRELWKHDSDMVTKFHIKNNAQLRTEIAIAQQGLLAQWLCGRAAIAAETLCAVSRRCVVQLDPRAR